MVRMAQQEWQQQGASNARRRSLETAMKEPHARTKVAVRHLPPSLSGAAFHDQIAPKFAGAFTWCAYHPGKTSHKRQTHSRAYINFKKPEDVIDFYEAFNGHVFVNERGAQYKALVEYAPYQRVPKPRSKKDVREGTIFKDPEYLAFVEQLAKPAEYLPSAEIQLEHRDAERAAALASGASKDTVVVTPLMEFVRLRRAAKSTPQRGMSSSAKLAARSGGLPASAYNVASQKRSSEKGRSGSSSYAADGVSVNKESASHSGAPREEVQRKERDTLIERKRKDAAEGKEKKSVREAVAAALSSARSNSAGQRVDSTKEKTVLTKDMSETTSVSEVRGVQILSAGGESGSRAPVAAKGSSVNGSGESTTSGDAREPHKREYKRKQLLVAKDKDKESAVESGQVIAATNGVGTGAAHNHRHRSSASSKVGPGAAQQAQSVLAYRATSPGDSVSSGKQSHRQELGARTSRGSVQPAALAQGAPSAAAGLDSQAQSQVPGTQVERGGKRPPRPQAIRLAGKEQAVSLVSSLETEAQAAKGEERAVKQVPSDGTSLVSSSEKQDARRLRNKDRPDRPVWTPRRREGVAAKGDGTISANGATPAGPTSMEGTQPSGTDVGSKSERVERSSGRQNAKSGSEKTKRSIGAVLMDQSLVAGIGNIYRAEILFVVGLHPDQPANTVSRDKFEFLWERSVRQMEIGVEAGNIITVLPEDAGKPLRSYIPSNSLYVYNQKACGKCGGVIKVWTIAQRSVYACEACQPPPLDSPTVSKRALRKITVDEIDFISAENGDDVYDDGVIPEKRPTRYSYSNSKEILSESAISDYDKDFRRHWKRVGKGGKVVVHQAYKNEDPKGLHESFVVPTNEKKFHERLDRDGQNKEEVAQSTLMQTDVDSNTGIKYSSKPRRGRQGTGNIKAEQPQSLEGDMVNGSASSEKPIERRSARVKNQAVAAVDQGFSARGFRVRKKRTVLK